MPNPFLALGRSWPTVFVVAAYVQGHPNLSNTKIAAELGLSRETVIRAVKLIKKHNLTVGLTDNIVGLLGSTVGLTDKSVGLTDKSVGLTDSSGNTTPPPSSPPPLSSPLSSLSDSPISPPSISPPSHHPPPPPIEPEFGFVEAVPTRPKKKPVSQMTKQELGYRIPAEDHTPMEMALCRITNPRKPHRLTVGQRHQIQMHGITMEEVQLVADWFESQKHHKNQTVDYYCCRELKTLINKWVSQLEKATTWAENDTGRKEYWVNYHANAVETGDGWAEEYEGDLVKHGLITLEECRIFGVLELKHDWNPTWEAQYEEILRQKKVDAGNTAE